MEFLPSQTTIQDNSAARATPAAPWRIKAVSALPDFRLAVRFYDTRNRIVDCSSILKNSDPRIYPPLAEPYFFAQVKLELGALAWPNRADLDPGWLHAELADKKT